MKITSVDMIDPEKDWGHRSRLIMCRIITGQGIPGTGEAALYV
jgi:Na+-translocating ferredoxin:NAD+ oxidoreductase RnfC subunit